MTKAELESKHLAELHALAAEAGVSGYRMLPRAELVEKLASVAPEPEAALRASAVQSHRRPNPNAGVAPGPG